MHVLRDQYNRKLFGKLRDQLTVTVNECERRLKVSLLAARGASAPFSNLINVCLGRVFIA